MGVVFGKLMINNEHPTSDIQLPTSKGWAKPREAKAESGVRDEG
jgi:hypothetical protein